MDAVEAARAVGKAVVAVEHDHFVEKGIDNSEHIPRVLRIAVSIAQFLRDQGQSEADADKTEQAILDFGKQLFMEEWMRDLAPDEDAQEVFDQGSVEFDRIMCDAEG